MSGLSRTGVAPGLSPGGLRRKPEATEVIHVEAFRNCGQPEGHPDRGQRRLGTRRHALGHLISVLFNLAELGGKPVRQTVPRDNMAVSPGDVRGR